MIVIHETAQQVVDRFFRDGEMAYLEKLSRWILDKPEVP